MVKEKERYEVRFGGSGGQGIITAAIIFAEAAGVYDGKHVCQSETYGPESRGGASNADVVISEEAIDYPRAIKLDLLLAMNQAACDSYLLALKPDGLLVVDSALVTQIPTSRAVAIPFTQIAQKDFGKKVVANMVALGAVGYLSKAVTLKSLEAALLARIPKGMKRVNRQALRAGIKAAKRIDLNALPGSVIPEEEEV